MRSWEMESSAKFGFSKNCEQPLVDVRLFCWRQILFFTTNRVQVTFPSETRVTCVKNLYVDIYKYAANEKVGNKLQIVRCFEMRSWFCSISTCEPHIITCPFQSDHDAMHLAVRSTNQYFCLLHNELNLIVSLRNSLRNNEKSIASWQSSAIWRS